MKEKIRPQAPKASLEPVKAALKKKGVASKPAQPVGDPKIPKRVK